MTHSSASTSAAGLLTCPYVIIVDTDFHPLDSGERHAHPNAGATAPVIIEDGVFVGMQTLVLKGVTIGAHSVIGAGSVVTADIPPGVIAAGKPARVIRPLGDQQVPRKSAL